MDDKHPADEIGTSSTHELSGGATLTRPTKTYDINGFVGPISEAPSGDGLTPVY